MDVAKGDILVHRYSLPWNSYYPLHRYSLLWNTYYGVVVVHHGAAGSGCY